MGPVSLGGSEERRVVHIQGGSSLGEPSLDRRRTSFSVGENMATRVWQQGSENGRWGAEPCPAHPA